jgi:hypothetical protein
MGSFIYLSLMRMPFSYISFQLDDRAVDELLAKTFENYLTWCKFLGRKSNIWLPSVKQEIQQHKLLYIALYLLIWGEASNVRLMPECLCYIFHHMSYELYGVLSGAVSLITGEKVRPAYGGDDESFLNDVVKPIYNVIFQHKRTRMEDLITQHGETMMTSMNSFGLPIALSLVGPCALTMISFLYQMRLRTLRVFVDQDYQGYRMALKVVLAVFH